jgi:hypothetical protein
MYGDDRRFPIRVSSDRSYGSKDGVIEPRLEIFLMAARAGLLAICAAIEKFIGFEKRKRSE